MIGNQTKGRGFRGLLDYLENQKDAKLIGGNMGNNNARALAREFKISRQLNPEADRVVYHASLSLPQGEQLDEPTWNEIANRYLEEMGFDSNQYVVYRHSNTEHDHIHICASRIRLDNGKIVHDSWDYKRSENIIRQIERDYSLQQTQSSHDKLSRNPSIGQQKRLEREQEEFTNGERLTPQERPIKQQLQELIDRATVDKPTMPQLVERLQLQGVEVRHGLTRNGKSKGISYSWNGQKFSGTTLGAAYTFPGLQKHKGIDYQPQRDDGHIEHLLKNLAQRPVINRQLETSQEDSVLTGSPVQERERVESQSLSLITAIARYLELEEIEQSVTKSSLSETLPQLTEQLSQLRQQLEARRTAFDDLDAAIADVEQQLLSQRTTDTISDFIEQSVVESSLIETLPQLAEQLSQYRQQLQERRTAFDDLKSAIADVEQQLLSQRTTDTISDFIEQSVVEPSLIETLPQLTEQFSQYRQQLQERRTAFDDLDAAIADVEQQLLLQRTVDTVADFIEQSVVESALVETLPQLTEQLSQYRQQLQARIIAFNDLDAAIADVEQLRSQRAVDTIADFIEQSVVEPTLLETLPQLTEQLSQYRQQLQARRTAFNNLDAAIADVEQRLLSQKAVDTIAKFIEQSVVESSLIERLPQLTEQLSQYRQQLSAGITAFGDLESAITTELQSHTEKKAISSISDYIEQSVIESALTQTVLELTQQLSQYKEQLITIKATFNDLDTVLANDLQSIRDNRVISSISDYVEQSVIESALTQTVLELTQQLSQYKEQLITIKATFNDLDTALANDLQSIRENRVISSISNYVEQSTIESALTETILEVTQQLSQYKEQLITARSTFNDLDAVLANDLQSIRENRVISSISNYVEQSTIESALTETILEVTQQLSQYKEQLITAKATFNDLDAALANDLQSIRENRVISSISDYIEQSTIESALTETVLELTQQLSQSQQQLEAGRTIFDDLEAAIVCLEQLHRSQKPVDAIALNQTPTITTDKPNLKDNLLAELYNYYSADLQNLLVTDRDKEIAIRALLDNKPAQEVEEIITASPAGWTHDEARKLVLIASNQLATQESEIEQQLDQKQSLQSELLASAVPIAVELINWQLRKSGSNSLRFKRATLERQGKELVFTHDERGEIFRVKVNRNQSGELEYSLINVGKIESEDIQLWQKAERILQQIREEAERQERRQSKGMSL
ncbi:relaxase/mobilization nuclease domain-containing protein (plasmid) [Nostoc sp. UHCC 0302]|uniref:relaxase/mobilization nuclease domain-containing protein n=1 Tax=Nostoc sp. UHCC 0302 TaxID=3134896 RepID=UPI00311C9B0C